MSKLLQEALQIASEAHAGQYDKGGKEYIAHPIFVATLVDSEFEKAAALLHDVVEDSDVTILDLINSNIPKDVIEAVKLLTKDNKMDYFDYLERIKKNEIARKVKIADLTHNSDRSRLIRVTEKDVIRLEKYQKAIEYLS